MSIITIFPDIRGPVVYPFCYEIDHHTFAILSLFRFGDHVLFSLRSRRFGSGGRKKERGARARHAYLLARTFCPICCRDMFHKHLSTATEFAAILSTAREMMFFTKTKRSYFRFAPPNYPRKSAKWPLQATPHPLARRAGLVPVDAQGVVTKSYWTVHQWHFRKSEASFPV